MTITRVAIVAQTTSAPASGSIFDGVGPYDFVLLAVGGIITLGLLIGFVFLLKRMNSESA